jgi:hypothetical protein
MTFGRLGKTKSLILLYVFVSTSSIVYAQNDVQNDSTKHKKIKMTSFAFGGTGLLLSNVNNQFSIMNGGRGSATFNNRYTFGGGGWGMPKGVKLPSNQKDTFNFFKFGYGGLEFG